MSFVHASVKNIHGKPYRFSMLANQIVKSDVYKTISQLGYRRGKYFEVMKNLLSSAAANAVNKGIDGGSLIIEEVLIGRGRYLKRIEFKGRGRVGSKWRPHTNLTVILKNVSVK